MSSFKLLLSIAVLAGAFLFAAGNPWNTFVGTSSQDVQRGKILTPPNEVTTSKPTDELVLDDPTIHSPGYYRNRELFKKWEQMKQQNEITTSEPNDELLDEPTEIDNALWRRRRTFHNGDETTEQNKINGHEPPKGEPQRPLRKFTPSAQTTLLDEITTSKPTDELVLDDPTMHGPDYYRNRELFKNWEPTELDNDLWRRRRTFHNGKPSKGEPQVPWRTFKPSKQTTQLDEITTSKPFDELVLNDPNETIGTTGEHIKQICTVPIHYFDKVICHPTTEQNKITPSELNDELLDETTEIDNALWRRLREFKHGDQSKEENEETTSEPIDDDDLNDEKLPARADWERRIRIFKPSQLFLSDELFDETDKVDLWRIYRNLYEPQNPWKRLTTSKPIHDYVLNDDVPDDSDDPDVLENDDGLPNY